MLAPQPFDEYSHDTLECRWYEDACARPLRTHPRTHLPARKHSRERTRALKKHSRVQVCACTPTHTHTDTFEPARTHTPPPQPPHTRTRARAHPPTHRHAHTHTHTHTHTNTYSNFSADVLAFRYCLAVSQELPRFPDLVHTGYQYPLALCVRVRARARLCVCARARARGALQHARACIRVCVLDITSGQNPVRLSGGGQ